MYIILIYVSNGFMLYMDLKSISVLFSMGNKGTKQVLQQKQQQLRGGRES